MNRYFALIEARPTEQEIYSEYSLWSCQYRGEHDSPSEVAKAVAELYGEDDMMGMWGTTCLTIAEVTVWKKGHDLPVARYYLQHVNDKWHEPGDPVKPATLISYQAYCAKLCKAENFWGKP